MMGSSVREGKVLPSGEEPRGSDATHHRRVQLVTVATSLIAALASLALAVAKLLEVVATP